jgi:hypothetical protein
VYVTIENDDNSTLVVKSVVRFEKKSAVWTVGAVAVRFIKLRGHPDGGGRLSINTESLS